MNLNQTDFTPLFERVGEQPYGLKIKTNNPQRLQIILDEWLRINMDNKLYRICIPSIPDWVFVVHQNVELPE
jgi:hypothetical protein